MGNCKKHLSIKGSKLSLPRNGFPNMEEFPRQGRVYLINLIGLSFPDGGISQVGKNKIFLHREDFIFPGWEVFSGRDEFPWYREGFVQSGKNLLM